MRGEHIFCDCGGCCIEGSSPHARGALALLNRAGFGKGIIPACAGSTHVVVCELYWRGDHPRMRGEHTKDGSFMPTYEGSSPHARGARMT